jgi:hypothetical protein
MTGLLIVVLFVVLLALLAGRSAIKKSAQSEVQKLLKLAKDGTLSAPQLIASGYDKQGAESALKRLRDLGLAEFDVDESGAPVYRVQKAALEAQKHKGW